MSSAQTGPPSARLLFKDILQGSGLYSAALMGQRLAGVILVPITTRFLVPADYGVADLLGQVGSVLSILLGLQFSQALGYFYFQAESGEARRSVVGTTVMGAAIIGVFVGTVCWPFSGLVSWLVFGNASAALYLRLVFVSMPAGFLAESLLNWLRVENRPGMFVLGSLVRTGATMAGIVVLVAALRLRVWGMLYTALTSAALAALFLAVYCFRAARPRFDARLFFRMLRFAAPIGLSGIAMFLIHFGDRFVLPHYRSLAELGIYVLAYKIGMLLSVAYAAFQTYWSAQVFHIMRRDDAETVFARLFTYVILALSFCGLGLIVCSRPALRILVAPAFQGAAPVVPVIVIAYYIRSVGDYLRCLFLAAGHPSYDAICNWAGAVVCLTGYLTLIPRFGMWGAAFATAAAFTVIGVLSVVWTCRLRPYPVEAGRLVKIGVALAAGAISYGLLPAPSLVAQIGLAALSLALFLLTLWLLRFPTLGELQAGRTVFQALARGESKVSAIYLVNL